MINERTPSKTKRWVCTYRGGMKKTGVWEDVLCNGYFSTLRDATDKQSSSVERVGQVAKGWSPKQRLGAFEIKKYFAWKSISLWLLSIPKQFFKIIFCSQKWLPQKSKHTDTYTSPNARNCTFCLSLMSKSSYEFFDKPPGGFSSARRPVFERFKYLVTGPPNFQITQTNMWVQPKGTMSKCKALETALNKELLSSHGHLKKCLFHTRLCIHQSTCTLSKHKSTKLTRLQSSLLRSSRVGEADESAKHSEVNLRL